MALPPFTTLVDEHRTALWGFVVASVGPQAAPDVLQETLLHALRAYPSVRDTSNLRGWLFTIARSRIIDGARASARRPEVVGGVPERGADDRTADHELWRAVQALPDKQRRAVVLRFVGDLPYADIAALVECSEAAARQNVRAGLARLREELT